MGKTISITLPRPIEKFYQDKANERDVSRSRVIVEILENYYNSVMFNNEHPSGKEVDVNSKTTPLNT